MAQRRLRPRQHSADYHVFWSPAAIDQERWVREEIGKSVDVEAGAVNAPLTCAVGPAAVMVRAYHLHQVPLLFAVGLERT